MKKHVRLHVNIDHVATLRNARGTPYPDPLEAAEVCLRGGADGITVHLREDRRHIVDGDVEKIRAAMTATFNLEVAATHEMLAIASRIVPEVITLVPERREERTTEGGLNVVALRAELRERLRSVAMKGIRVSLFITPDEPQIRASADLTDTGVRQVEFHTGDYANALEPSRRDTELSRLHKAAQFAHSLGLDVAAGHGLTRANVAAVAQLPHMSELNIGHALVADALFLSLDGAVHAMRKAMDAEMSALETKAVEERT